MLNVLCKTYMHVPGMRSAMGSYFRRIGNTVAISKVIPDRFRRLEIVNRVTDLQNTMALTVERAYYIECDTIEASDLYQM